MNEEGRFQAVLHEEQRLTVRNEADVSPGVGSHKKTRRIFTEGP
jgi:hypothetical protein